MTKVQILVVEDEALIADDIQYSLEDMGYIVPDVCATGEDAIATAQKNHPNLILMDINLQGDMDGIETANAIRAKLDIPIIYLTAYADAGFLERAKITDPFGYLLKPFKERELHATIEMALKKHKLEQALRESEETARKMGDAARDAIIMMNNDGLVTFWNLAAEEMFGYKKDEAMGQGLHTLIMPEYYGMTYHAGFEMFQGTGDGPAVDETMEFTAQDKDRHTFPVEVSLASVMLKEKWHAIGVVRDISERKLAQEMQKDTDDDYQRLLHEFRGVIDAIPGALMLFDRELSILWVNQEAKDELSINPDESFDLGCRDVCQSESDSCEDCPVVATIRTGAKHENELMGLDGIKRHYKTIPIMDEFGNVDKVLAIAELL